MPPRLREVQQALARDYGFASWAELKREIEDRARTLAESVDLFLEKSVNRYGTDPATGKWGDYEPDGPARGAVAARLLSRHPEIATDSIHTAVAAYDLGVVRRLLAKDPGLVHDRSPFDGWTPLPRLAHARLPTPALTENALAIAGLLLDAGADPNAGWTDSSNAFTPLVGVIGGGEAGQAPHPLAEDFARLLIARGADPFVPQALYNTSLGADSTAWLDFLWSESEKRGETGRWSGPAPKALGGEKCASALAYLLGNAVPNHIERTRWLLSHGADARGINFYSREPVIKHALIAGRQDVVALLLAHGAERPSLSPAESLSAAIGAGNMAELRRLAELEPGVARDYPAMVAAIQLKRADMVEALLDLGMSPDVADDANVTALHHAAGSGAVAIARLLIARGAAIDPVERHYHATPLRHAVFHHQQETVDLLAPLSHDIRGLCFAGAADRLRQVLSEDPTAVNRPLQKGETALFSLPEDDEKAQEIVELLLGLGADPGLRNPAGFTPAEAARRRGLDDAAALMEPAG